MKTINLTILLTWFNTQALEALNKKDITEIKSYGKPPALVEKVLEAVMILRALTRRGRRLNDNWVRRRRVVARRQCDLQMLLISWHIYTERWLRKRHRFSWVLKKFNVVFIISVATMIKDFFAFAFTFAQCKCALTGKLLGFLWSCQNERFCVSIFAVRETSQNTTYWLTFTV